jgi:hypothetical protein
MNKFGGWLARHPILWIISVAIYLCALGPFLISAAFTPAVILGFLIAIFLIYWAACGIYNCFIKKEAV